jgi:hypothetical protein
LDEEEFRTMLRIVNHEKPLFPGNFRAALDQFDTDANGVITFDEFVSMHQKFPQLLWPLFQLQDRMQERSLGRKAWTVIGRRDAQMRKSNQAFLQAQQASDAARISRLPPSSTSGDSKTVPPGGSPPSNMAAPGRRLATGDMAGIAGKNSGMEAPKSRHKKGRSRDKPSGGAATTSTAASKS